jgi:hypothetical protein
VNSDVSRAAIEVLLQSFVSEALGLTIGTRIQDTSALSASHRVFLTNPESKLRIWVAWHTNKGPVSTCATYHQQQAVRIGAHVLHIAWLLAPNEHYEGWWHCYPRRPGEWIKGAGTHRDSLS